MITQSDIDFCNALTETTVTEALGHASAVLQRPLEPHEINLFQHGVETGLRIGKAVSDKIFSDVKSKTETKPSDNQPGSEAQGA